LADPLNIIATTAFGLEAVAARELKLLGYDARGSGTGRVAFEGDAAAVARASLWLRSADRVLVRIGQFEARDFDALFEGVKSLPWEQWIAPDDAFPVNGRCVRSQLMSVPACQRATKRAIVDRLMAAHRRQTLPETGVPVKIEIAIVDDVATLTLDTSGVGLHKRGYRPEVGEAALKETLAAGLVLLSVWRPDRPLVDPFCGTGTIAIEAAMIGRNIAPGLGRAFDAERWPGFAGAFAAAREEARSSPKAELAHTIHASDVDERALAMARRAAAAAGVERDVHFKAQPFEALSSKAEYGCVIANPPYGVRLGEEAEIDALYRSMPAVFRRLPTWSFHILTARLDLETIFGQAATRRRKLYNSRLECTYFIFLGPKRAKERGPGPDVNQDAAPEQPAPARLTENEADAPAEKRAERTPAGPAFGGLRERDEREARDFAACLSKNVRHLRRYPSRGVTCYRVYERDCPDVPLIIDVYEGAAHVAEYEREHSRSAAQQADWWDRMRGIIAESLQIPREKVYAKEKRRQRDLTQHEKVDTRRDEAIVHEGGLKFIVNLSDYIDTGLFLDHRLTRAMVREESRGARMLNLFCYTGSFSVYAAAGGAASTTSVDLSNTYLEWAKRNLELNGLWGQRHRLVKSDVMEFLQRHPRGEHYDLAVVDPPTFSNSSMTEEDWQVAARHGELLLALRPLMRSGGVVYFSTNYRRFKLDEAGLAAAGFAAREISRRTVPPEYRNTRIHRCWRLTAGAPFDLPARGGPGDSADGPDETDEQ